MLSIYVILCFLNKHVKEYFSHKKSKVIRQNMCKTGLLYCLLRKEEQKERKKSGKVYGDDCLLRCCTVYIMIDVSESLLLRSSADQSPAKRGYRDSWTTGGVLQLAPSVWWVSSRSGSKLVRW